MKVFSVAAAICIALVASIAESATLREVRWGDLVPPLERFDDPFETLTPDQKLDLSMIDVVRSLQARPDSGPRLDQLRRYETALDRLKRANVDIDGLLARRKEITEKRRKAAEAVNENLDGQRVRIPGYVLPLEMDGKKVTEFLLVPYVGACIHAPTPPPNQIVHVRHAKGFETSGMFAPVWVNGLMRTVRSTPRLSLVDGAAEISTGYALDAEGIKAYSR